MFRLSAAISLLPPVAGFGTRVDAVIVAVYSLTYKPQLDKYPFLIRKPLGKDNPMTVYDYGPKLSKFEGMEEVVVSWKDEPSPDAPFRNR